MSAHQLGLIEANAVDRNGDPDTRRRGGTGHGGHRRAAGVDCYRVRKRQAARASH